MFLKKYKNSKTLTVLPSHLIFKILVLKIYKEFEVYSGVMDYLDGLIEIKFLNKNLLIKISKVQLT